MNKYSCISTRLPAPPKTATPKSMFHCRAAAPPLRKFNWKMLSFSPMIATKKLKTSMPFEKASMWSAACHFSLCHCLFFCRCVDFAAVEVPEEEKSSAVLQAFHFSVSVCQRLYCAIVVFTSQFVQQCLTAWEQDWRRRVERVSQRQVSFFFLQKQH